jgi:hypothetical protein
LHERAPSHQKENIGNLPSFLARWSIDNKKFLHSLFSARGEYDDHVCVIMFCIPHPPLPHHDDSFENYTNPCDCSCFSIAELISLPHIEIIDPPKNGNSFGVGVV